MLIFPPSFPGYLEDAADHPAFPAGASAGGTDLPTPAVLRHPAGPGPAEQVRVPGAVSPRAPPGTQAARREVAQGGQAGVQRGAR